MYSRIVSTGKYLPARILTNAELEKIPFTIVYGDRESDDSLAVRERGGGQSTRSLGDLLAHLATLVPWQAGAEPSLTS